MRLSRTNNNPMSIPARAACIGALWIALAVPAAAQSVRDVVAGARLGSGYAGLLNLAATPDISAATYKVTGNDAPFSIDVLRVPYESRLLTLSSDVDLYWKVAGGYLSADQNLVTQDRAGSISSDWSAYSLTGGLLAKIGLGSGFTLVPGLDLSLARLKNDADYAGAATALQPFLDGLLFNWHSDAYLVTPNVALEWRIAEEERRISVVGHVAWSWISTFDASDSVLKFNETAGAYSIRADYAAPTGMKVLQRPLDWLVLAGYAGFFGPNRDALGFTSVAEVGLGVEVALSKSAEKPDRARLSASYLFGPNVTGWTVGLGLGF